MQKLASILIALCLIQVAFSACSDGTFTNAPSASASKSIQCFNCLPYCKTCTVASGCATYADNTFKGLKDSATLICTGGSTYYNKNENACGRCADGCSNCIVDYDYCLDCIDGWDWDRSSMKCVRATLGLAAVVLALSVLTLIFGVIICLLACKL